MDFITQGCRDKPFFWLIDLIFIEHILPDSLLTVDRYSTRFHEDRENEINYVVSVRIFHALLKLLWYRHSEVCFLNLIFNTNTFMQ